MQAREEAKGTAPPPGPEAIEIAALGWLADDADRVAFLTMRPPRCETGRDAADIIPGANNQLFSRRDLGRIAFESPVLLGGAASRTGLSCGACHTNGRGNPGFFIRGVSGRPGSADVTSSILSKTRGNGIFDPTPIPDISLRNGAQIQDRRGEAFRDKVHGLIAEEFDGGEPEPQVFEAVLSYLDGLDPSACAPGAEAATGAGKPAGFADLDAAQAAADAAFFLPDLPASTRIFWLRVARNRLERVYEREAEPVPQFLRDRLLKASGELAAAAEALRKGEKPLPVSPADWRDLSGLVKVWEPESLYNPQVLKAALGG